LNYTPLGRVNKYRTLNRILDQTLNFLILSG